MSLNATHESSKDRCKRFSDVVIRGLGRDLRADGVETDALASVNHRKLPSHGEDSTLKETIPISCVAHIYYNRHTFDAVSIKIERNQ